MFPPAPNLTLHFFKKISVISNGSKRISGGIQLREHRFGQGDAIPTGETERRNL